MAVDDFANMDSHIFECDGMCGTCDKWQYADEAQKLIGGESDA